MFDASLKMSSEAGKDSADVPVNNEEISQDQQTLEDVESKLGTFSDRVNLCTTILDDLKDLNETLVRKSLQDVTLPVQK